MSFRLSFTAGGLNKVRVFVIFFLPTITKCQSKLQLWLIDFCYASVRAIVMAGGIILSGRLCVFLSIPSSQTWYVRNSKGKCLLIWHKCSFGHGDKLWDKDYVRDKRLLWPMKQVFFFHINSRIHRLVLKFFFYTNCVDCIDFYSVNQSLHISLDWH